MEDQNNPFQPALDEPVDDSILKPVDSEHHADTASRGRFLDGFSSVPMKNIVKLDQTPTNGAEEDAATGDQSDSGGLDLSTSIDANLGVDDYRDGAGDSAKPAGGKQDASAAKKAEKEARKAAKRQAKLDKKNAAAGGNLSSDGKVHQFTISLPVIILLIIAIAGVAGTAFFAIQNSKNANDLADKNAEIAKLQNELGTTTSSDKESTGQFGSLQDKISAQAKELTDTQNQLKTAQQGLKDMTDKYNTANAAATNNKSVTDNINALLGSCTVLGWGNGVADKTACSIKITPASTNGTTTTPASLTVSPKS